VPCSSLQTSRKAHALAADAAEGHPLRLWCHELSRSMARGDSKEGADFEPQGDKSDSGAESSDEC